MVQHAWVFVLVLLAALVFVLRVSHKQTKSTNDGNTKGRRGVL
jgi:hypothetical protein